MKNQAIFSYQLNRFFNNTFFIVLTTKSFSNAEPTVILKLSSLKYLIEIPFSSNIDLILLVLLDLPKIKLALDL